MSLIAQAIGTRLWNVGATTLAPLLPFTPPSPSGLQNCRRYVTFRKAINRFTSGTDTQFTLSPRLLITDITDVSFHLHRYTFVTETAGASHHFQLDSASKRGFRLGFMLEFVFNVWYFASCFQCEVFDGSREILWKYFEYVDFYLLLIFKFVVEWLFEIINF